DPVGLPRLPSIRRKCLFPSRRGACDIGPDEADINTFTLEEFLVVKFAPSILEAADHRCFQHSTGAVCPVDTPMLRFGIVKTYSHALYAPRGAIGLVLVDISRSSPNLSRD